MIDTATRTRTGFTQVNLLPPENRERQQTRRKVRLVAVIGGLVIAVLVFFSFVQGARVSDLQDKVAGQNAKNATLQAQATQLEPYEGLRQSLVNHQKLVQTALAGDVSWSGVLDQLAGVVPPDVWLTSVAGTTAAPATPTSGVTTTSSGIIGSLTFQGNSLDTDGLVRWLRALVRVPGWQNAWVSTAQKTAVGTTPVWQFSSSVDIDQTVLSQRGRGPR